MPARELACANAGKARIYQNRGDIMNLKEAIEGKEYIITGIETGDEELDAFLFSLGCYSVETITVVAQRRGGCTVSIKDGRYHIDTQLAEAIRI